MTARTDVGLCGLCVAMIGAVEAQSFVGFADQEREAQSIRFGALMPVQSCHIWHERFIPTLVENSLSFEGAVSNADLVNLD